MKILYAIQGTGNGHLCRALEIIPHLQQKGELDILVSGIQGDITLPYPVKYQLKGLSFIFGKKGGVDVWQTYKKNRLKRFYKEIKGLPVREYDLVISDFEPVSSWACFYAHKRCYSLSHQSAVLHPMAPQSTKKDAVGIQILKTYAPTDYQFGFHFKALDQQVFTPVIRSEIRALNCTDKGYYTVYLPSYSDKKLLKIFNEFPNYNFQIFSKHNIQSANFGHIKINPINNKGFLKSMANCKGVICGAGFETPAEALFLKKKVLVIPMKFQYEQQCNATMLHHMGVKVLKNLKKKRIPEIREWLKNDIILKINFPNQTSKIIDLLFKHAAENLPKKSNWKRAPITLDE
ncbi:glycosyltransferase family protein [Zunongwangia sp.]|uniref:glycosyltransferase family protein n=1 Tax=Zunongwangia sp. TaxID=1965325 RepID=UPI003AA9C544